MSRVPSHLCMAQFKETKNLSDTFDPKLPTIPPRPSDKRTQRSVSPTLETGAKIPTNKSHFNSKENRLETNPNSDGKIAFSNADSYHPSVNLPSIGQEGLEYAGVYKDQDEKLIKQPRKSNKPSGDKNPTLEHNNSDLLEVEVRTVMTDTTGSSGDSLEMNSIQDPTISGHQISDINNEHGIPKIGLFVPMYPNAGDVQAPSQCFAEKSTACTKMDDTIAETRNHVRNLNGRGQEIPSDAYGRYGHGVLSQDRFDKAYYKKHPELFKKELGSYGEAKPEWALSSEDLNKIVQDTANLGTGRENSPTSFGTPSEQIGFKASEEYICRISTPRSQSELHTPNSNISESKIENLSSNINDSVPDAMSSIKLHQKQENSVSMDQDHVIHIDDVVRCNTSFHKALSSIPSIENFEGCFIGENDNDQHKYGAPILASDEVAKAPMRMELQPAVVPLNENEMIYGEESKLSPKNPNQIDLSKKKDFIKDIPYSSSSDFTPLHDAHEYEPLFPEEEKNSIENKKPISSIEKIKCPEMSRRFPSRDIWEDTPKSLQYTTIVSTLQLPEDRDTENFKHEGEIPTPTVTIQQDELPQQESKNQGNSPNQQNLFSETVQNQQIDSKVIPEITSQRFPSRDIWEDTPDSLLLKTTVATTQIEKESFDLSEEQDITPTTEKFKPNEFVCLSSGDDHKNTNKSWPRSTSSSLLATQSVQSNNTGFQEPSIPTKQEPLKKSLEKSFTRDSSPPVPLKTKPQIPYRPTRLASHDSSGNSSNPTSNVVLTGKAKPPIPSRPSGGKIAMLQSSFLSDLNKRLQLGPQASKKDCSKIEQHEEFPDKTILIDPRKTRARGPVRRVPKTNQLPISDARIASHANSPLKISTTVNVWSLNPELEYLNVSVSEGE